MNVRFKTNLKLITTIMRFSKSVYDRIIFIELFEYINLVSNSSKYFNSNGWHFQLDFYNVSYKIPNPQRLCLVTNKC